MHEKDAVFRGEIEGDGRGVIRGEIGIGKVEHGGWVARLMPGIGVRWRGVAATRRERLPPAKGATSPGGRRVRGGATTLA
jgi:hypothetical protein